MYLGFTVLDLSKWKMYDFHYQYMKPKLQEMFLFCYMDTYSFICTIKTEDFYKVLKMILKQNLIHRTIQMKELICITSKKIKKEFTVY